MRTPWRNSLFNGVGLVVASLLVLTLSACSSAPTKEEIVVAGSTTVMPIAEIGAEKFTKTHDVSVLVSGLGSSAGIEAVSNGTAHIASSSRDLTPEEEKKNLYKIPIAHDGIAVIVNENNPVQNLTSQQLQDIYSGKITNWKDVGGNDLPILVVNRDEASGTREAFKKLIMKSDEFDPRAAVLPGTGQVRDVVSRTEGAIGYISIGFVDTSFAKTKVKALAINSVHPTDETIEDASYPISRDLYFFTAQKPEGITKEFIDFILSSEMNETIREAGYVPVSTQ